MESRTTIEQLFQGNKISVPKYQRAYSWETPKKDSNRSTQTDVFLQDLEDYIDSETKASYYFGHFLFEHKEENQYDVIDGQQRLTTVTIFLSALFAALEDLRPLKNEELELQARILRKGRFANFSTVDYDDSFFRENIVFQTEHQRSNFSTHSSEKMVDAFDYFYNELQQKEEKVLVDLLDATKDATCTTHEVEDEAEAIQMFIFQNNRGKKPTNLEIVKARFMYHAHLYGGNDAHYLIDDIKSRFQEIYEAIASIEYNISEDDVLTYTLRVHFNSLTENGALSRIDKELSAGNAIAFISDFTQELKTNFRNLRDFFGKDERDHYEIHSLIVLGGIALAMPFVLKAYKFNIEKSDLLKLCDTLGGIILRHRIIGTRADLSTRLQGVFRNFTAEKKSVEPILAKIEFIKKPNDWWWAYWENPRFEKSLEEGMNHSTAKYLLWKYENHLESLGKAGYVYKRYDSLIKPELEHIAPSVEPEKPHGYGEYTEEFRGKYLNCLGNYILLPKSHNCSIGNIPFKEKHKTYTRSAQQLEVRDLVKDGGLWDKEVISKRNDKIKTFVLQNF